ncbi:unnamed protein product [Laminaria digitata]
MTLLRLFPATDRLPARFTFGGAGLPGAHGRPPPICSLPIARACAWPRRQNLRQTCPISDVTRSVTHAPHTLVFLRVFIYQVCHSNHLYPWSVGPLTVAAVVEPTQAEASLISYTVSAPPARP